MPCNQSHVIYRINYITFPLCHHLEIVVVLDIVALRDCNLSIDDHEFGVKGSQSGTMVVDDFECHIWYLIRTRQSDLAVGICVCRDIHFLVIIHDLKQSES